MFIIRSKFVIVVAMFFIYIIYLALLLLIALNSSFIVIDMFESIFWKSSYLNFDRISYYTVKDSFMFTANYLCLFRSSPSFCWAILLARFSSESIWFIWSICSLKIGLLFESASYSYSYLIYFLFNFSFCQLYLIRGNHNLNLLLMLLFRDFV